MYCPFGEVEKDLCDARRNNFLSLGNRRFAICGECRTREEYNRRLEQVQSELWERGTREVSCPQCGRTFMTSNSSKQFCSAKCYRAWRRSEMENNPDFTDMSVLRRQRKIDDFRTSTGTSKVWSVADACAEMGVSGYCVRDRIRKLGASAEGKVVIIDRRLYFTDEIFVLISGMAVQKNVMTLNVKNYGNNR